MGKKKKKKRQQISKKIDQGSPGKHAVCKGRDEEDS